MCKTKLIRQNIVVSHITVNGESEFTKDIYLNFIPDEMKVIYSYYENGNTDASQFLIWSNLVNNYICTCEDQSHISCPTVWTLHNTPIKGSYTFQTRTIAELPRSDLNAGNLVFHLEFIKYLD